MFQLICEVKVILLLMCKILCGSQFGHFSAIFEDENNFLSNLPILAVF